MMKRCELIFSSGKTWLFTGKDNEKSISTRNAQRAYNIAKQRAGIERGQGIHTLFAAYLLEADVDLHIIQVLMGYKSIRTTLEIWKLRILVTKEE